jgi:hypothetical protein
MEQAMKDALKLALEAMERYQVKRQDFDTFEEAITAIKAALAQPTSGDYALGYAEGFNDACKPAQEPVAWMHEWEDGERAALMNPRDNRFSDQPATVRPLVYGDTTPQQREPLTDDARGLLVIEHLGPNALLHKPMSIYDAFHMGIDAAEAAHGIKETTE